MRKPSTTFKLLLKYTILVVVSCRTSDYWLPVKREQEGSYHLPYHVILSCTRHFKSLVIVSMHAIHTLFWIFISYFVIKGEHTKYYVNWITDFNFEWPFWYSTCCKNAGLQFCQNKKVWSKNVCIKFACCKNAYLIVVLNLAKE